jgi:hypothetical protein
MSDTLFSLGLQQRVACGAGQKDAGLAGCECFRKMNTFAVFLIAAAVCSSGLQTCAAPSFLL